MPIKELSLSEQIAILKKLDENEKEYDKNISLAKADPYILKYKYNIDTALSPITLLQESQKQQPTIQAIKNVSFPKVNLNRTRVEKTTLRPITTPDTTYSDMPPLLHMEETPSKSAFKIGSSRFVTSTPGQPSRSKLVVAPTPNHAAANGEITEEAEEPGTSDPWSIINLDVVQKYGFPLPSEIAEHNLEIEGLIQQVSDFNKRKMAPKLASLSKQGHKESQEYANLKSDCQELIKYKQVLKNSKAPNIPFETEQGDLSGSGQNLKADLLSGSGFRKIGRFYMYMKDLKNGILKIRRKNKSKVPEIPDRNVSEGVKQLLLKRYNPKFPYTDDDRRVFSEICTQTGLKCKPYSAKANIYFTNMADIQRRFLELIGEIKAGNNNIELKNELSGISDILLKNNKITKEQYKKIQDLV